jgi:hypothetical protein
MNTVIPSQRLFPLVVLIVLIATVTSGCEAIGTIFKAGVWTGVITIIVVLAIVAFVAMRFRRS